MFIFENYLDIIVFAKLDKHFLIKPFAEEKQKILMAFSLYTNGAKLFSTKKSRAYGMLECLNGMRVLSAFWVIYAHSNIVSLGGPVFNIKYLLEVCTYFMANFSRFQIQITFNQTKNLESLDFYPLIVVI